MSRRGTNIRKRADGRWEGRYYIVDTAGSKKCKSVYGHSYKEVTERLLSAKAASLNQTIAPKQSAITVKEVAEKWLKSIASKPEVLYHSKVFYYIQQIYQTKLGRKCHRSVKSQ